MYNKKAPVKGALNYHKIFYYCKIRDLRLLVQHQRHYQHQQFFVIILFRWF